MDAVYKESLLWAFKEVLHSNIAQIYKIKIFYIKKDFSEISLLTCDNYLFCNWK